MNDNNLKRSKDSGRGPCEAPGLEISDVQLNRVRWIANDFVMQLSSLQSPGTIDPEVLFLQIKSITQQALDSLTQTGCWGEANRIASNELWRIARVPLAAGSLQEHARAKPRGYAGDFEMLEKIDAHYLCQDPLGRAFDRFFQQQAAPEAVRSRMRIVADAMTKTILQRDSTGTHLASVGSGPALDVARALRDVPAELRHAVRVTLIDIDPDALNVAAKRLQPLLPATHVTCVRENLARLSKKAMPLESFGKADLLSCTGLFDYLDDDSAVAMLAVFWKNLNPGGTLLAFNFAPTNPSRAYMEWIGQWYLIYRTAEAMNELAQQARIEPAATSVESGPQGICPYIRATKR